MNRCQCLTLKGEQCKLTAKPGSEYCWRHTECANPRGSSSRQSASSVPTSDTTKSQGSSGRSRIPMRRTATNSSSTAAATPVDLGLVQMPTPLITRVVGEITDRLQEGDTAEEATAKTLDDIVEELGFQDVSDLVDLNEEEIDYFIATILLHENQDKLADIVQQKIDEQNIRDPHARLVLKSRELLQELAGKFCRCIQKVLESNQAAAQRSGSQIAPMTEGNAIAICRRGVINSRGLTFPRFSCKTYPKASDKTNFIEAPIFLPSKENKKLLRKHEGFRKFSGETDSRSFKEWAALGKAGQDQYLKAVKK